MVQSSCSHHGQAVAVPSSGCSHHGLTWAGSGCSQHRLTWDEAKQVLSCRELAHGTLAAQNTPRRFLCTVAQCVLTRMGPCPSLLGCGYLGPLQKQNNLKQNNTKPLSAPCCGLQMAKQCQKEQETGVGLGGLCQVIPVPAHVKAEKIQQW